MKMKTIILKEIRNGYQWNHPAPKDPRYVQVKYKKNSSGEYVLRQYYNRFDFTPSEEDLKKNPDKVVVINGHKLIEEVYSQYLTTLDRKDFKSIKDAALRKMQDVVMANEFMAPKYESLAFRIQKMR